MLTGVRPAVADDRVQEQSVRRALTAGSGCRHFADRCHGLDWFVQAALPAVARLRGHLPFRGITHPIPLLGTSPRRRL
jgi:hypothetical protein